MHWTTQTSSISVSPRPRPHSRRGQSRPNIRLRDFREGKRFPIWRALLFQYGRYLLISSSREGGQPAQTCRAIWK